MGTSLVQCFNGIGTIVAALASTAIVNPDNAVPDIEVHDGTVTYKYFGPRVTKNVPSFFLYFTIVEIFMLFVILYVIWVPDEIVN